MEYRITCERICKISTSISISHSLCERLFFNTLAVINKKLPNESTTKCVKGQEDVNLSTACFQSNNREDQSKGIINPITETTQEEKIRRKRVRQVFMSLCMLKKRKEDEERMTRAYPIKENVIKFDD